MRWAVPPSSPCLLVSDTGRVIRMASSRRHGKGWHTLQEKELSPNTVGAGYLAVEFKLGGERMRRYIHRLVAEAFLPASPGRNEVNHIDGDKTNNHVTNLEWVTHSENHVHAAQHGLRGATVLTPNQVHAIRKGLSEGHMPVDVAAEYGVTVSAIRHIQAGRSWRWLLTPRPPRGRIMRTPSPSHGDRPETALDGAQSPPAGGQGQDRRAAQEDPLEAALPGAGPAGADGRPDQRPLRVPGSGTRRGRPCLCAQGVEVSAELMTAWLNKAGGDELLPKDEVLELARIVQAWQNGTGSEAEGIRATNRLVETNLRLVPFAWRRYYGSIPSDHPSLLDLFQEGVIGLRDAILRFDPTRGYSLSTYALTRIRKSMQDWLRSKERTIRRSGECEQIRSSVERVRALHEAATGETPTIEEVAAAIKRTPEHVRTYLALHAATACSSLNLPLDESSAELLDLVESPETDLQAHEEDRDELRVVMEGAGLTDKEREVIRALFPPGEPPRLVDVAPALGVSTNYLKVVRDRALRKCRRAACLLLDR